VATVNKETGMKLSLIVATLALSACGTRVGYVDPDRAIQQTDEWRTVQADAKAYADSRQPDVDRATAAVKKSRDEKATAEKVLADEAAAADVRQQVDAEVRRRLDVGAKKIGAAMSGSFDSFAVAQNVVAIAPLKAAFWIDPRLDLTAQLAKHYDQQIRAGVSTEVQELRAENAALRAKQGSPPIAKK